MRPARAALFALATLFVGCGDDGPPGPGGYYGYGAPCRDDLDCGPAVSCVERAGGSCLPICRSDYDCPVPYRCHPVPRHGAKGSANVCE